MLRNLLLISLSIFVVGSTAAAVDLPPIKEGLWKTESSEGQSVEQCVGDEDSVRKMITGENSPVRKMCDSMKLVKQGAAYVMNLTCKMMGMTTVNVESTITGDFSKRYTSTSKTTFNPPVMGMANKNSTETVVYMGDCPSDMAPGTVRMADGKVVDPMKMAENMPDMSKVGEMMKGIQSGNPPSQAQMQKMIEDLKRAQNPSS